MFVIPVLERPRQVNHIFKATLDHRENSRSARALWELQTPHTSSAHTNRLTCTYTCVIMHMYTYIHTCTHRPPYTDINTHIHMYTYAHVYIHNTCTHKHIYIDTNICMSPHTWGACLQLNIPTYLQQKHCSNYPVLFMMVFESQFISH